MSISLEQFVECVAASGVLSAAEVQSFLDGTPTQTRPKDAETLARALYNGGKLTAFQAKVLYTGKPKGLLFGDYVVLDQIGAGGMGVVYKAQHRRMKRMVALKVLPPSAGKADYTIKRFYREVEAAARLNHPNIVTAYDAREADGIHYLVMEYVEGQDLSNYLAQHHTLPVEQALKYVLQTAKGLEYAHGQGVYHRDIKPANLLLDKQGTIKILDMGLARFDVTAATEVDDALTKPHQVMGTIDYMAPEQAASTKDADHRSDIYALGCTFYRMLTGESPYAGETPIQKIIAHREAPIPTLRKLREDVPEAIDWIFQKMIAKQPRDRFQTMSAVIAALDACSQRHDVTLDDPHPMLVPLVQAVSGGAPPVSPTNTTLGALFVEPAESGTANWETVDFHKRSDSATIHSPPRASARKNRSLIVIGAGILGLLVAAGIGFKVVRQARPAVAANDPASKTPVDPQTPVVDTKDLSKTKTPLVPPPPPPGPTVDLLKLLDVKKDALRGEWEMADEKLVALMPREVRPLLKRPGVLVSVFQIPYAPPEEYDLTVVAEHAEGFGPLALGLVADGKRANIVLDPELRAGGGKAAFFPKRPAGVIVFTSASPVTIVCKVRKTGIILECDGKPYELPRDLPNPFESSISINPEALCLGAFGGSYGISKIELTPVTGSGRSLR